MSFLRCRVRGPVLVAATIGTIAAGCGGGSDTPSAALQSAPSTTEAAPTTTTVALTPEQEVEQAYLKSLEVYAVAASELNSALLDQGFTGETLQRLTTQVNQLSVAGTPVQTDIKHETIAVQVGSTEGEAVVFNEYIENSYRFEKATGRQIDVPNDMRIAESVVMQRVNGVWKIARIVR